MAFMTINLFQLLLNQKTITAKSVVCFRAHNHYPLLFFSVLLADIKKEYTLPIEIIDLATQDIASVKGKLETSFLGQKIFCWLRNISDVPKTRKELYKYLAAYTGPNIVAFFVYHADASRIESSWLDVSIPEAIDRNQFVVLATRMYGMQELYAKQCASLLISSQLAMQLDDACLLTQYAMLIGSKNISSFIQEWLEQLIKPKTSLFMLSKHFFAKDARTFFSTWLSMSKQYPIQFWIVFWSEQLWSAAAYISLMRSNDHIEAKKVASKLPVTFLQKNWREYSIRELKNAHDYIYKLDYSLKNGGNEVGLDLFYSKFFHNELS